MGRSAGRQASTSQPGALAALQAALAAEQAACYGYGIVGAHLTGARYAAASVDWIAHQRARDDLTQMITARGAQPHPAAVAYQLPIGVHTGRDAVSLAIILEHLVTAAYLGLVARPEPAQRELAARHMQAAAVRAAHWSGRSQPFPGLPASALHPDQANPSTG
jgi:Domain of unknown function (DUF4439)